VSVEIWLAERPDLAEVLDPLVWTRTSHESFERISRNWRLEVRGPRFLSHSLCEL